MAAPPCNWSEMPFWKERHAVAHQPPRPRLARLEREPPPHIAELLPDTGRDLLAATEPVAFADPPDTDNRRLGPDWPWTLFMASLRELLDVISVMVRDDADNNPGWTHLADPVRCPEPWLRVLAQWSGIRRWDAMSSPDLRALIGPHAPGMWRGTRAAMIAAIRRFFPVPADYSYSDILIQDRPVAYWPLGDLPGARLAREQMKGLHAIYEGSTLLDGGTPTSDYEAGVDAGKPDSTYVLPGIDGTGGQPGVVFGIRGALRGSTNTAADFRGGHLEVPPNPSLTMPRFTVELWMRPRGGSGGAVSLASVDDQGESSGFVLGRVGTGVQLELGGPQDQQIRIPYSDVIKDDGPTCYFRLGDAGAQAADEMGNLASGSLAGGYTRQQPSLLPSGEGASTAFTNTAGRVNVPGPTPEMFGDEWTFECWIMPTAIPVGDYSSIFGAAPTPGAGSANATAWQIRPAGMPTNPTVDALWTHRWSWNRGFAIPLYPVSGGPFALGKPEHLVWTMTADQRMTVYRNCDVIHPPLPLEQQTPHTRPPLTNGFVINGHPGWPTGYGFLARQQEVAVYPYVLSPQQVLRHCQAGRGELYRKGGHITVPDALPDNEWTYVTGTYDGETARLHVDGELRAEQAMSFTPAEGQPLYIGKGGFEDEVPFLGGLDEIAIYDHVLSDERINIHRCRGLWIDPPADIGRFIYFEERADGDPYKLRAFTYSFIDHDPEKVRLALEAAKPAGISPFEYDVRVGQAWFMVNGRFDNWQQADRRYENWWEMYTDEPTVGVG